MSTLKAAMTLEESMVRLRGRQHLNKELLTLPTAVLLTFHTVTASIGQKTNHTLENAVKHGGHIQTTIGQTPLIKDVVR